MKTINIVIAHGISAMYFRDEGDRSANLKSSKKRLVHCDDPLHHSTSRCNRIGRSMSKRVLSIIYGSDSSPLKRTTCDCCIRRRIRGFSVITDTSRNDLKAYKILSKRQEHRRRLLLQSCLIMINMTAEDGLDACLSLV